MKWFALFAFVLLGGPALAGPSATLSANVVPAAVVPPAQWIVAHNDGCFEISGTTTDFSCQMRWRDGYAADSMIIDIAWRLGTTGAPPAITGVSFKNNAATCSLVPGTSITDPTDNIAIAKYLCPNMTMPGSAFDINFAAAAQLVLVQTTEIFGCANPCVAEAGNAVVTAVSSAPVSITSGKTTSTNEFVQSFAYGPCNSFSTPSETIINNAGYGCSSFLTQYQIGATPGTYTNSLTISGGTNNVLQSVAAFKPNTSPTLSPPAIVGQQIFTAYDTQAKGSAPLGAVFAYTGDYSLVVNPVVLTQNPGGLLSLNSSGTGFTLNRALTPADDGTYTGQLSVTQGGVALNQPISLIVAPPRTYLAGATSNCPSTPPPAAQRAGFTKLVNCIDPAVAFYQTTTNWMQCNDSTLNAPGFLFYPNWPALTCRDITYPIVNGRQVMEFHWHADADINYMRSVGSSASFIKIISATGNLQADTITVGAPIANSYWEFRLASYPNVPDDTLVNDAPNIFVWANCPPGVANCLDPNKPEWSLAEEDFTESYGPRAGLGGSAFHWWNNKSFGYDSQDAGLADVSKIVSVIPGWSANQMTTFGTLNTTDNVAGMRTTAFINDLFIPGIVSPVGRAMPGGSSNPYDIGLLPTWDPLGFDNRTIFRQPNYWSIWLGGTFGATTPDCQGTPACAAEGGQPDQINDFEYISVWSCPEYATDPTCSTTKKGLAQ